MIRRVDVLHAERCTLTPLRFDHAAELRRIHATPEVAWWWGSFEDAFPFDEPTSDRWTIEVDGAVAGLVQAWSEEEPDYRHAGIDVFLDPALHGRGIGTDAVRRLKDHLHDDRGYHRLVIDPASANLAAIGAYTRAGFAPVGTMRASWRNPDGVWEDSLLMESIRP